uniref:Uncharacterized protein n=1 Tax=Klebsiella pneumoniae TaxID=573 RepID=A0A8B0SUG3_KLEPN|nr:hypothetical protein [Klebsiella pneumoniae]
MSSRCASVYSLKRKFAGGSRGNFSTIPAHESGPAGLTGYFCSDR